MLVNYDNHRERALRALIRFRWLLRENHCTTRHEQLLVIEPREFVNTFLAQYPHARKYADYLLKYAERSWLVFRKPAWRDRKRMARQSFPQPF